MTRTPFCPRAKRPLLPCVALVAVFSSHAVLFAAPIHHVVLFGDSLSDPGNAFLLTGGQLPPDPPYYKGRFSNGPVWIEQFSEAVELDETQVTNLAIGGATTGRLNLRVPALGGMIDQLDRFLASEIEISRETLFVIWGGANDLFVILETGSPPELVIESAMENIAAIVIALAEEGAQTVMVPNLPDLGATPEFAALGSSEIGTQLSVGFNVALESTLDAVEEGTGMEIIRLDVFSLFKSILAAPADFGLTDVENSCLGADFVSFCDSPSTHLFWDGVHPTTAGHATISNFALETIGIPFFVRGDCNGDGQAGNGPQDALTLLRHLFLSRQRPACRAACDVNGDGQLRISDVVGLLTISWRLGADPAPPYPSCGPGLLETDQQLGCDASPACL